MLASAPFEQVPAAENASTPAYTAAAESVAEMDSAALTAQPAAPVPAYAAPVPQPDEAPPSDVRLYSEPEIVREEAQSPAPVSEPVPALESAPVAQPGRGDPASVLASLKLDVPSDLVQIETDPHKVAVAPVEEEEVPRAPRVRRGLPQTSDEPLVQIETRGHDSAPQPEPMQQA